MEDARYRRLEEYSTGMKQRLKLAQALVHDPSLLLLDEPTSGLDPSGRDAMLRLLLTLGREHGKSILLSTHLLGDVERVCETVLILHQGQLLLQGGVDEVRTRRQNRYRLQVEGDAATFREELRLKAPSSCKTMDEASCAWRCRSVGLRGPFSRWPIITASSSRRAAGR